MKTAQIADLNFPTITEIKQAVTDYVTAKCVGDWPEDEWIDLGRHWSCNIWTDGEAHRITVYREGTAGTDTSCGISIE